MGFKKLLQKDLKEKASIPEKLLDLLPKGFQELDKRVIIKLKPELQKYDKIIAKSILNLFDRFIAVWKRGGKIEGKFRKPTGLTHLIGDKSSEVVVKENNIRYKFDFTRIMFAKGNTHERALLPKRIKKGETIIDMFAGIGYFSLGMAKTKKPTKIYSIEWNPESFKYLLENIKLNKVENIIKPIHGNCKTIVPNLVNDGIYADRIIMGLLPAPTDAISVALQATKSEGTIVIYEGVEPKESTKLFDEFSKISEKEGFSCSIIEKRIVKAFKPHEYHTVLEILVKK